MCQVADIVKETTETGYCPERGKKICMFCNSYISPFEGRDNDDQRRKANIKGSCITAGVRL